MSTKVILIYLQCTNLLVNRSIIAKIQGLYIHLVASNASLKMINIVKVLDVDRDVHSSNSFESSFLNWIENIEEIFVQSQLNFSEIYY